MLCIKLETKRKITYPENFFWFLETVEFSTSVAAFTYWQQTCPSKANFAFPRTPKLWKWTERKSPIFASKVKSLVGCSYSLPIRPYCMLHSCFQIHAFPLEDLGGTLNWSVSGLALRRLCPWCWKRGVAGRSRICFLSVSLFPLSFYLLRAMFF